MRIFNLQKVVLIIILIYLPIIISGQSQTPSTDLAWILNSTYSDDFSTQLIDTSKWDYSQDWRGWQCCRCLYNESNMPYQTITNDLKAVRLNDSYYSATEINSGVNFTSIITQKKDSTVNRISFCGPQPFQVNGCDSNGTNVTITLPFRTLNNLLSKKFFKYGFFEIRAKFPQLSTNQTNNGLGANFWMINFGKDATLPKVNNTYQNGGQYSEIDVFEMLGCQYFDNNGNGIGSAKHQWGLNSHWKLDKNINVDPDKRSDGCGQCYQIPNDGAWHTWGVSWQENLIKYYFDGNFIFATDNHCSQLFPMQLVIDLNVQKGNSDISTTLSLYEYKIDYLRIYGLNVSQQNNCYLF